VQILLLISILGFAASDASANPALSRQISALGSSLDSFSDLVRGKIASLEGSMEVYDKCFNKGLVYGPN
jgi:hypothetical protein